MRGDLPSGTVTLLFTDIEGSTKLLHELGEQAYAGALAAHREVLRGAFARHGGVEVDTQGDAFFYAFPEALEACEAAREGREALLSGPVRVRMGIHTGTPHLTKVGYVGEDVHKGARIAAAGHGGQVLLSKETRERAGVEAMDLGEHRLKDFADAVWIFQLGTDRFPPLKTISNTNLPRPVSSFVGREHELERVVALLHAGTRLLTLSGPGGSGKTRLAIEAAAEVLSEHRNGVFWVELATIRDPALVTHTIGLTLGARDGLADHIQEKEMLLVLDNFEQVVEAASELPALLSACPNLRMLVTSRELLRVRGEVEYPVPPLAQDEAVELFCTRSGLRRDDAIAELCRRLDDLPLAVELAAARTSVLSPAQINERLATRLDLFKGGRDADPRQATLRGTIEWSYELLTEDEQRLFARLSVFSGGCTFDSAQRIAAADIDTLQSLVDKSLVRHTGERFWMLETIREFAVERLQAAGEAAPFRDRHSEYFLSLSESIDESNLRGYARETLDMFEQQHDNLRAAFDRFEAAGESQKTLRLAGQLAPFWRDRGYPTEGLRRLSRALAVDDRPTAARAFALEAAGELAGVVGDLEAATRYAEEGVALSRRLGDPLRLGGALQVLGLILTDLGNSQRARGPLEESVRIFADAGREDDALWVKRSLAWAYKVSGDVERARELNEENLRRAIALGDEPLAAITQGALGMIAIEEGRVGDALALLKASLEFFSDFGDVLEIVLALARTARGLAVAGKASPAARVLSCQAALSKELGFGDPSVVEMNDETLASIHAQLDEATFVAEWDRGRAMTAEAAVDLALEALT